MSKLKLHILFSLVFFICNLSVHFPACPVWHHLIFCEASVSRYNVYPGDSLDPNRWHALTVCPALPLSHFIPSVNSCPVRREESESGSVSAYTEISREREWERDQRNIRAIRQTDTIYNLIRITIKIEFFMCVYGTGWMWVKNCLWEWVCGFCKWLNDSGYVYVCACVHWLNTLNLIAVIKNMQTHDCDGKISSNL